MNLVHGSETKMNEKMIKFQLKEVNSNNSRIINPLNEDLNLISLYWQILP